MRGLVIKIFVLQVCILGFQPAIAAEPSSHEDSLSTGDTRATAISAPKIPLSASGIPINQCIVSKGREFYQGLNGATKEPRLVIISDPEHKEQAAQFLESLGKGLIATENTEEVGAAGVEFMQGKLEDAADFAKKWWFKGAKGALTDLVVPNLEKQAAQLKPAPDLRLDDLQLDLYVDIRSTYKAPLNEAKAALPAKRVEAIKQASKLGSIIGRSSVGRSGGGRFSPIKNIASRIGAEKAQEQATGTFDTLAPATVAYQAQKKILDSMEESKEQIIEPINKNLIKSTKNVTITPLVDFEDFSDAVDESNQAAVRRAELTSEEGKKRAAQVGLAGFTNTDWPSDPLKPSVSGTELALKKNNEFREKARSARQVLNRFDHKEPGMKVALVGPDGALLSSWSGSNIDGTKVAVTYTAYKKMFNSEGAFANFRSDPKDQDCDGVSDEQDQCSQTRMEQHYFEGVSLINPEPVKWGRVWLPSESSTYAGCNNGQLTDKSKEALQLPFTYLNQDDDNDGVLNREDRCLDTSTKSVHKTGRWAGCSDGQKPFR